MKGHIQQRGKNSFRLKFDAGRDEKTGERKTQFHTLSGTKRQAQIKLAEQIRRNEQDHRHRVCPRPRRPLGIRRRYQRQDGRPVSRAGRKSDRAAHWRQVAAKAADA